MKANVWLLGIAFLGRFATAQTYTVADADPTGLLGNGIALGITNDAILCNGPPSGPGWNLSDGLVCQSSGCTLLPMPYTTGNEAYVFDRNAAGIAVGKALVLVTLPESHVEFHAFQWFADEAIDLNQLLPYGSPFRWYSANSINSSGDIVGLATFTAASGQKSNVGLYSHQGALTVLGDLPGALPGSGVNPKRIDDAGWIIGDGLLVGSSQNSAHAVEWSNGVLHDIHDPTVFHGKWSHATGANRFHQICGYAYFWDAPQSPAHAVLWQESSIVDLGTLMGGESVANGINDLGDIVGRSFVPAPPFTPALTAVVWRNGVPIELNALLPAGTGWTLYEANGIDNAGRIVGQGWRNGVMRPFVLTPVCAGHFTWSSAGCAPGGAPVPNLFAVGCPTPGSTFALTIENGAPQKQGVLLVGLGSSPLAFSASCSLAIAPLAPVVVPITLDSNGELFLPLPLPTGLPIVDVNLQAILPGSNGLLGSTNALALHIQ